MQTRTWRARTVLSALALIAPLALVTTASAAPRDTARPHSVVYDALGDSYASGYGVPPYDDCGRSQAAYAAQLDGRVRVSLDDFVACAGATTASAVAGGQLTALDEDTELVTLSIGGNDIGWSSAVVACLGGSDAQCAAVLSNVRAKVTGVLPGLLDAFHDQVVARAPGAHVVVTGYPRLFSPEAGPFLAASAAEQEALNAGADVLNDVLSDAATEHGFEFVDVTKRFDGHGVNAAEPWLLGPFSPGAFHPNAAGYEAYAAAVTSAIGAERLR